MTTTIERLHTVRDELRRLVAAALTEAAALLEAHEGANGGLDELYAFELGRDAQAEGLPATNGRPR